MGAFRRRAMRHDSMSIMEPEVPLPEPWSDLRGEGPEEQAQRETLRTELVKELSAGHALHGRAFSVAARSDAKDEILIVLDDDEMWALVHLTWRGTAERPPWPQTIVFSTIADAVTAMRE